MKISILTPDFSHNCFGRAWLLAKVLQRHYDVEMIGPAFGDGIWGPLKNSCDFEIKMVKGYANGKFEFTKMLNMISGDVIYASKPLMTSFGVGLVKKIRTRKPLILDIDDWELGFGKEFYESLVWYKKINDFRLSILNFHSYYYNFILNRFIRFADAITVSGNVLHSQYGGTIVSHGRDVNIFDPEKFDKVVLKRKYLAGKGEDAFVVGFIGTPRPHKGLEDLIAAVELLKDERLLLMIVGIDEDGYCISLKKRVEDSKLKDRAIFFPHQPFKILPEFLAIADLVVIPQRDRAASYAQVPAKIFDAMAMAKPIISTNVPVCACLCVSARRQVLRTGRSDIPEILDGCGWIIEPENPKQLAKTIKYVLDHPVEAKERGEKARQKCKREYSWDVIEEKLVAIFGKYKTN